MNFAKSLPALCALVWVATACATLPPTGETGAPLSGAPGAGVATATVTAGTLPTAAPQSLEQAEVTQPVLETPMSEKVTVGVMENRARNDLSVFLGIDAARITTAAIEQRTWREGLQSCAARRGMLETVAPVQGWLIVLQAQNRTFEYRAGDDGRMIRCPQSTKPLDPIR